MFDIVEKIKIHMQKTAIIFLFSFATNKEIWKINVPINTSKYLS